MMCCAASVKKLLQRTVTVGDNVTFLWDFGDGTPTVTTIRPYVYHVFTQSGCYYVNNTAFNVISRRSSNLTLVCVEDELLDLSVNTTLSASSVPAPFLMTMSSGSDFFCHVWTGDGTTYTYEHSTLLLL